LKSLPEQSPVPVRILPYDGQDDEVDFRSIWRLIARRKAIILLSLLAALVVASIYVLYSQASYRAQTRLLPPQRQYIQGLLIDYKGLEQLDVDDYSPERVFEEFLKNPDALLKILKHFQIKPHQAIYVGDSQLDELAAKSAGIPLVAFRNKALISDYHIENLKQLEKLLEIQTEQYPAPS